jgi:hypothetical protein
MTRSILLFCALGFVTLGCGVETRPNPNFDSGADGSVRDSGPDGEAGGGSGGDGGSSSGGDGGSGGEGGGGSGGDSGGSGGDGGSGAGGEGGSPSGCDADTECAANVPQCNASGVCGRCSSNAACEGRTDKTRCDGTPGSPTRGQCVQCTSDTHCTTDEAPECVAGKCVECSADLDCPASKPQCSEAGACEACDSNEACEGRPGKVNCETTSGQCVECLGDEDCENPEPQCTANACAPCTGEAACAGRNGTEHCNTREGLQTSGQCVQCTGATEDEECVLKSCNQALGMCTGTDQETVNPCQPCAADSECDGSETGAVKCVTHMLGTVNLGSFCFYAFSADNQCANAVPGLKPYSVPTPDLSIDEHAATFCLPVTSCQAVTDAALAVECGTDSTMCGVANLADGICLTAGPSVGKCSYGCINNSDCLGGIGATLPSCVGDVPASKTCQPEP